MNTTHKPPLSRRDIGQMERRRIRAAALFRTKLKHAEIARRFMVSRAAIRQWYVIWKKNGRRGLRGAGRLGRKPRLTTEKIEQVRKVLLKGPEAAGYQTEFWNLDRIAAVIRKTVRVSYHPSHVWKVLANMGWSCQKPETRAKERNEKAIRNWAWGTWPRIQKKG